DVGGDHLLDEWHLRDRRGQHQSDGGADRIPDDEHLQRAEDVWPEEREVVDQCRADLTRLGHDVGGRIAHRQPDLQPSDDHHCHEHDHDRVSPAMDRARREAGHPGEPDTTPGIDVVVERWNGLGEVAISLTHAIAPVRAGCPRSMVALIRCTCSMNGGSRVWSMVRGRGRSISKMWAMRPGRGESTTTRSARKTASVMLWVTKMT